MGAAVMPLTQEDFILLLADGAAGPYDLDPVRLMKGCFIVSQSGRSQWRSHFRFRPYDYGPFDSSVYSARDALVGNGLLEENYEGRRYPAYALTDEGRACLPEIERELGEDDANWVRRVGAYVTSKSFSRLLDEIYEKWPEFATASLHQR